MPRCFRQDIHRTRQGHNLGKEKLARPSTRSTGIPICILCILRQEKTEPSTTRNVPNDNIGGRRMPTGDNEREQKAD